MLVVEHAARFGGSMFGCRSWRVRLPSSSGGLVRTRVTRRGRPHRMGCRSRLRRKVFAVHRAVSRAGSPVTGAGRSQQSPVTKHPSHFAPPRGRFARSQLSLSRRRYTAPHRQRDDWASPDTGGNQRARASIRTPPADFAIPLQMPLLSQRQRALSTVVKGSDRVPSTYPPSR